MFVRIATHHGLRSAATEAHTARVVAEAEGRVGRGGVGWGQLRMAEVEAEDIGAVVRDKGAGEVWWGGVGRPKKGGVEMNFRGVEMNSWGEGR